MDLYRTQSGVVSYLQNKNTFLGEKIEEMDKYIKALTKEKQEKHLKPPMNAVNTAQIADAMRSLLPMLRDFFSTLTICPVFS
jgi:predicted transcriptional regulator